MANTARPYGLQPIRTSDGGLLRANPYYVPASLASLGIGTPVNLGGTSNTVNSINGYETIAGTLPSIVVATGGDGNALLGSIVGFDLIPTSILTVFNPASTERVVHVADHPSQVFSIVDDGAAALTASVVGLNANVTVGTVNAFTGTDSSSLDTSTPASTATFQLKILGLLDVVGNEIATSAQWKVQINNHVLANITAGV